jgi:hypothetical protein
MLFNLYQRHWALRTTKLINVLCTSFVSLTLELVSTWKRLKRKHCVLVLIYPIGLPSLFLPFDSSGVNGEEISKILEIQTVSPPEERSWMLEERVMAGMSYRQASSLHIIIFLQMENCWRWHPLTLRSFSYLSCKQHSLWGLIFICHQNYLFFMKPDGSTAQFRTADDVFEEASKLLGKQPTVDSSSTETNVTLVLPQDVIDLWSLKCIRKAIRSICDIKGSSSGRNQLYLIFLSRHFCRHCRVSLFAY